MGRLKHYWQLDRVFVFGLALLFCILSSFKGQPDVSSLNTPVPLPARTTFLTSDEIARFDSIEIDFQFRGNCYASSSTRNAKSSNGEWRSPNVPRPVDSTFARAGFYLVINDKELVRYPDSLLGCRMYLVNTSDTIRNLRASDSRLYIVAEVLNEYNQWVPISYLPSSTCGNSYHTVTLDRNEYWGFTIPVFKGEFRTKLRYVLQSKHENLYSNEVVAYVNPDQWNAEKREGHSRKNLMDPYGD